MEMFMPRKGSEPRGGEPWRDSNGGKSRPRSAKTPLLAAAIIFAVWLSLAGPAWFAGRTSAARGCTLNEGFTSHTCMVDGKNIQPQLDDDFAGGLAAFFFWPVFFIPILICLLVAGVRLLNKPEDSG